MITPDELYKKTIESIDLSNTVAEKHKGLTESDKSLSDILEIMKREGGPEKESGLINKR